MSMGLVEGVVGDGITHGRQSNRNNEIGPKCAEISKAVGCLLG
jgi:hypothetical protein